MEPPQTQILEFDGFRIDAGKRLLLKDNGEPVPLTPKAFDTLLYLVQNSGRLIEKDELMREIWTDTIVEENNLNQNISILRRVFGEKRGEHRYIATIPGKGYEFVADVKPPAGAIAESTPTTSEVRTENSVERRTSGSSVRLLILGLLVLVGLGSLGVFLWRGQSASSLDQRIRSIAVLPFKPLVAENRDEALELGMADTLIARLSHDPQTIVLPLNSVRKYGQLNQDVIAAGRELGVDSILDGNIQRWGDKIRVNVRLMRVNDGSSLWTGTFDENFGDIFVVQDAISRKVASALALQLSGDKQTQLEKRYTTNTKAYEFYLRGRYHAFRITRPENQKAIAYFERAIEADPGYALAYAGLADAFRIQPIAGFAPSDKACPQAKAFATRALEIDDTLTDGYIVLGWVEFMCEWEWESAERHLKTALQLSPNISEAHRAYAHLLSNLGRHEEAIAEGKRAAELAPLTLITSTLEGYFLLYAGRYDEATSGLTKAIELDPYFWTSYNALGRVYVVQGRYEEAIRAFEKAVELAAGGSLEPTTQLGYALGKSGRRQEALAKLEELRTAAARDYVPMYFFAVVYNGLGEGDQALNYLEESFRRREVQMTFLKVDTRWDWLRSDPRFAALMKQMNFS